MINILVLTDNFSYWIEKINKDVDIKHCRKNRGEIILISDMFIFRIISDINRIGLGDGCSCCILDKEMKTEDYYQIILPSVKWSEIETGNFYKK